MHLEFHSWPVCLAQFSMNTVSENLSNNNNVLPDKG